MYMCTIHYSTDQPSEMTMVVNYCVHCVYLYKLQEHTGNQQDKHGLVGWVCVDVDGGGGWGA